MNAKVARQPDRQLELEVTEADTADWHARQRDDETWWAWLFRRWTKSDLTFAERNSAR